SWMIPSIASKKRSRPTDAFSEAPTWRSFGAGWRPLWAGFKESGFSVEWHDFTCDQPFEFAGSFHPDSVEICLNLEGNAEFDLAGRRQALPPASATFYFSVHEAL